MPGSIALTGKASSVQVEHLDEHTTEMVKFPLFPWPNDGQTSNYQFSAQRVLTSSGTTETFPLSHRQVRLHKVDTTDGTTVHINPGAEFKIANAGKGKFTYTASQ